MADNRVNYVITVKSNTPLLCVGRLSNWLNIVVQI